MMYLGLLVMQHMTSQATYITDIYLILTDCTNVSEEYTASIISTSALKMEAICSSETQVFYPQVHTVLLPGQPTLKYQFSWHRIINKVTKRQSGSVTRQCQIMSDNIWAVLVKKDIPMPQLSTQNCEATGNSDKLPTAWHVQ
jgi:hypothetical protein